MSQLLTPPVVAPPPVPPPGDPDALYEVVNGRRVELAPMGAFETDVASELLAHLRPFARSQGLGRAVNEMLFRLDPETNLQRRPDVAFVSYACWPRDQRVPSAAAWEVVPELAVEVVSPSNLLEDVLVKLREYFQAGVRLVWVVLPPVEQVYVYTSMTDIRVIDRAGTLEGEPVVPGFRLPVADLLPAQATP